MYIKKRKKDIRLCERERVCVCVYTGALSKMAKAKYKRGKKKKLQRKE